jgi:hypothetical protein
MQVQQLSLSPTTALVSNITSGPLAKVPTPVADTDTRGSSNSDEKEVVAHVSDESRLLVQEPSMLHGNASQTLSSLPLAMRSSEEPGIRRKLLVVGGHGGIKAFLS